MIVFSSWDMMSCGWKQELGWGEKLSEKGSVKQTSPEQADFDSYFPPLLPHTLLYVPYTGLLSISCFQFHAHNTMLLGMHIFVCIQGVLLPVCVVAQICRV